MMRCIGLTGIMGAGKSTVIMFLKKEGITVLSCDEINSELMNPQAQGFEEIVKEFGQVVLNIQGQIDRKKLADMIFEDDTKRIRLEEIMHPLIARRIRERLTYYEKEALVVVEVPLLFEIHWETFFDEVWVVSANPSKLLKRLANQRGIEEHETKRRWHHQLSQKEKCERANEVLDNSGTPDDLHQQIKLLLKKKGISYAASRR